MLEVGKWYFFDRPDGSRQIFLVEDIFYKDGGYKIKSDDYDFTSDGLTINWWKDYSWLPEEDLDVCKPLEKLTSQEAFVLLGYGFILIDKTCDWLLKLDDDCYLSEKSLTESEDKWWFFDNTTKLDSYTIHKAPEKKDDSKSEEE